MTDSIQNLINTYFFPLKESLLYNREDFVEEEIVNEYHIRLNELEKKTNYNLKSFKMNNEEDIYFIQKFNPIGFTWDNIVDTTSTVTGMIDEEEKKEKIFYKKDKLIFKLTQLINSLS